MRPFDHDQIMTEHFRDIYRDEQNRKFVKAVKDMGTTMVEAPKAFTDALVKSALDYSALRYAFPKPTCYVYGNRHVHEYRTRSETVSPLDVEERPDGIDRLAGKLSALWAPDDPTDWQEASYGQDVALKTANTEGFRAVIKLHDSPRVLDNVTLHAVSATTSGHAVETQIIDEIAPLESDPVEHLLEQALDRLNRSIRIQREEVLSFSAYSLEKTARDMMKVALRIYRNRK